MSLVDPCLEKELREKASQLGWEKTDFDLCILISNDWGHLKKEIKQERKENELLHYRFKDTDLDRKASEDHRIDSFIVTDQSPEEATIKNLAENSIAVTLDFNTLLDTSRKRKNSVLSEWRRTIFLADKHDIDLYVTTGADEELELRPPEMLETFVDSLDGQIKDPRDKIQRNKLKLESD